MNKRMVFVIVGWIAIVGVLGWSGWERRQTHRARAAAQSLRAQQTKVAQALAEVEAKTRKMARDVTQVEAQLAASAAPARMSYTFAQPTDEERAKERANQSRARVMLQVLPIARRAELSDEQTKRLAEILTERTQRMSDLYQAAREQRVNDGTEQFRELAQKTAEDGLPEDLGTLVGPKTARFIDNMLRNDVAGRVVQSIAADLCFGDEPLTYTQATQLRDALGGSVGEAYGFLATMSVQSLNSGSSSSFPLEQLDAALASATKVRETVLPLLTPAQREAVENRLRASELDLMLTANSYALWRAIRKGNVAPGTSPAPQ